MNPLTQPQLDMLARLSRGEYYLADCRCGHVRAGRKQTLRGLQALGHIANPRDPTRQYTLSPTGHQALQNHIAKISGATP